jgi:transcriptional regulator with XRE-family HTH domain
VNEGAACPFALRTTQYVVFYQTASAVANTTRLAEAASMAKSLGSMISEAREARGLTQDALAERLVVDTRTVQRWEANDGSMSVNRLVGIAKALGVPVASLLEEEPTRANAELLAVIEALPHMERIVVMRLLEAYVRRPR